METGLTPRVFYGRARLWLAMRRKYRTEQGFSLIEFLLVIALVVAALALIYFFFSKARASSDLNSLEQSVSGVVSAIENAKSSNGGAYPAGTINNLGSFSTTGSTGNTAPELIGSVLCPSIQPGGTCTNADLNNWSYSCPASNGGTSTVTLNIYIPPQNQNMINTLVTYFQNSYTGWSCTANSGNNGIQCTLPNVICQ